MELHLYLRNHGVTNQERLVKEREASISCHWWSQPAWGSLTMSGPGATNCKTGATPKNNTWKET